MTTDDNAGVDEVVDAERLTFFSDAVIAIAITLLALDLPLPHGETNREVWRSLGHGGMSTWPSGSAFW